jgi:hypothetical protein
MKENFNYIQRSGIDRLSRLQIEVSMGTSPRSSSRSVPAFRATYRHIASNPELLSCFSVSCFSPTILDSKTTASRTCVVALFTEISALTVGPFVIWTYIER